MAAKYSASCFSLRFWSITSFGVSWEFVVVSEPKQPVMILLGKQNKRRFSFCMRWYLDFWIHKPTCVINHVRTEQTELQTFSRPGRNMCGSLNQLFSNFNMHQNHQEGLLKYRCLSHSLRVSNSVVVGIYIPNKFPAESNMAGIPRLVLGPHFETCLKLKLGIQTVL